MKKILTIVLTTIVLSFFSIQAKAQVEKGTVIVEPYYGFSLFSHAFLQTYESNNSVKSEFNGLGPMGVRFEYFVSNLIGLGFDANYKSIELVDYYSSGSNEYNQSISSEQIRVMGRLNLHFVRTKTVDFYAGTGIGYKSNSWKFTTTDPYGTESDYDAIIPMAFRMSTGVRVFFTNNLGVNFELGIAGGSFATAGLTLKI